jgi:hypothetical protein
VLCSLMIVLGSLVVLETPPSHATHVAPADASATATLLTTTDRRVRAGDARIQMLMMEGVRRSATFASLIAALNATDVIVYIEPVRRLPPLLSGRMLLIPHSPGGPRYLRIQVMTQASGNDLIATIGHELQHALEVAAATDVQDQLGLERLYQQIGQAGIDKRSYDTEAARTTGRKIRAELAG